MSHLSPVSPFLSCTLVFLCFACVCFALLVCLFVCLFVCFGCFVFLECLETYFYRLQQLDDRPCFIARSATRKKKGTFALPLVDHGVKAGALLAGLYIAGYI